MIQQAEKINRLECPGSHSYQIGRTLYSNLCSQPETRRLGMRDTAASHRQANFLFR